MSELVEALAAHLRGELGFDQLLASLQATRKELADHRKDVSSMLAGVPDFLVASERDDWTATFMTLEKMLKEAEEKFQEGTAVEELAGALPQLLEELRAHSLSVRESAWSARGPTSHAGVNEILFMMEQLLDEQTGTDELFEVFQAKLEIELTRFEAQAELYQELPEFLAVAMEELLPQYRDLLESAAALDELEDEQLEELFSQFEEWGANFSACDLDYLSKRYSRVPTPIPAVNRALNFQLLLVEGLVEVEMAEYAVEQAIEILNQGCDKFLQEQTTLSAVDAHAYGEFRASINTSLEALLDCEDGDALKALGGELIGQVGRLVEVQSRAETEGGTRLDFKSE